MIEWWTREGYEVSTDPARLDARAAHAFLSTSYWGEGRTFGTVEKSLRGSLCFGLYKDSVQVGLARAVTDYATYAYIGDVYVLPEHRGRGLGKFLVECLLSSQALAGVRVFSLRTKDAHGLYAGFGFVPEEPGRAMRLKR